MLYYKRDINEIWKEFDMQKLKKILSVIALLILIPILFISGVILVNSYIHPDEVPSFFGWKPFIVLSGSMETQISSGDIVIVKEVDKNTLKKGDIIAFKSNDIVITHRIDEIVIEDNKVKYITKGDNNNTRDEGIVLPEQIEGIFKCNIPKLGNFAIFIQTPIGILVCLSIPIILLIIIGWNDSRKNTEEINQKLNKQKEMEKEIEMLKQQNEELKKK